MTSDSLIEIVKQVYSIGYLDAMHTAKGIRDPDEAEESYDNTRKKDIEAIIKSVARKYKTDKPRGSILKERRKKEWKSL